MFMFMMSYKDDSEEVKEIANPNAQRNRYAACLWQSPNKLTKKSADQLVSAFVVETPRVELGSSESTIEPSTCLFSS